MDEQTNQPPSLDSLTPRQIVEELDRYVIGQRDAKRMVAIALRTRWRRQRLPAHLRDEVMPKNIIMIGPTGVGKTEISRRLAKLTQAPFIKVEASKYTEIGYVGRDCESMVRDLAEQAVVKEAVAKTEQHGIIFLDEIDKIAGRERTIGPDVSREGVQRDLLPIVEGSTVTTKYGPVKTDHILFIAAGAFHVAKPSDLIPELQGRFPIRVELEPLTKDDFIRILTEPQNALLKQYTALLETEGITLDFTREGIEEIAATAVQVNERSENIGARRLFTIMERLLEEVSFSAPELTERKLTIDAKVVRDRLKDIVKDDDLSRYIL